MTQQDFLNIAQINPDTVNIWYTDTIPYTILGLTIPVLTISAPAQDVAAVLQQIQTITLPLTSTTSTTLTILTRSLQSVDVSGVQKQYYFFEVVPTIVGGVDTTINNAPVIFEPSYSGMSFIASGYNVLEGSIELQRASTYIMKSEEGKRSNQYPLLPSNINSLQTGTADKADIQDSNYSSTGWTNGRYAGSKTNRLTYASIDPALAGKLFKASYFSTNVTDSTIQSQSSADLVYEDFFYSNIEETPTPTLRNTRYALTYNTTEQSSSIEVYTSAQYSASLQFAPGDLIAVVKSGASVGTYSYLDNYEVMQITQVSPSVLPNTLTYYLALKVNRKWNNTVFDDAEFPSGYYPVSNNIMKLDPTKIFKVNGSKLEVSKKGKYLVKETGDILYVDKLGTLMQSNVGIKTL